VARSRSRRPSNRYARTFWALTVRVTSLATGTMGYGVGYMHGLFEGGRWVNAPVWWPIVSGVGLLLLGRYWSRRLGEAGSGGSLDSAHRDGR
jgi:hypothetical protein